MLDMIDLSIIVSAISGALVFIMVQKYFHGYKQVVAFCISFVMGIIGSDVTIALANDFLSSEVVINRAFGAFLCSALVVKIVIKVMLWINSVKILKN